MTTTLENDYLLRTMIKSLDRAALLGDLAEADRLSTAIVLRIKEILAAHKPADFNPDDSTKES